MPNRHFLAKYNQQQDVADARGYSYYLQFILSVLCASDEPTDARILARLHEHDFDRRMDVF